MPASSSQVFSTSVKGFGDQGKEDEEVRGDEPKRGSLFRPTQLKDIQNQQCRLRFLLRVIALSVAVCSQALSLSHLQDCGALFLSLRQSLELDTGVTHHSLANRFTTRLRTRSPLSTFRLPTPPSPQNATRYYAFS